MPEGDTVWRTAKRLHQVFTGEPLTRCDLRWPELSTIDFTGQRTVAVLSRGKHLLHRLDSGWTIHSHLRMDGQWRIEQPAARANAQTRALLGTTEWAALGQRLGMLDVVRTADEHTVVGHLGPDVLGPDWNPGAAAANLLAAAGTTIGAALLDQTNLAGVGTLYASETLFLERVNPWTPAGQLPEPTIAAIIKRAHRLLQANKNFAVQSTTGSRRHGETGYVHARNGQPCRRCGGGVRVAMIGPPTRERTMFYCPECQGGLGPTDDGRPQQRLGVSRP